MISDCIGVGVRDGIQWRNFYMPKAIYQFWIPSERSKERKKVIWATMRDRVSSRGHHKVIFRVSTHSLQRL